MEADVRPAIVVVEDEPQILAFVLSALGNEGYEAFGARNANDAIEAIAARKPALVVLDLGLPDRDGVELIRDLRSWSALPILVLSARAAEDSKIAALDAGADDYLTKPFGVGELQARVRAMLRRRRPEAEAAIVEFGAIRVDRGHRVVSRRGEPVHLTPIEYRLLCHLIAHADRVLTHRQLLREVWGPGCGERSHYLRVYVGHLRQKLEDDPTRPRHLLTETGVGYRFQL
jgi:two-component system KDP operon response regulator KdpE